jgi:recombination protein RecA
VLDTALEKKIVQKSGSHFSFEDERLGQGRQNATAFLREHPDVGQQILARLQASIGPEQVVSARLLPEQEAPKVESDAKQAGSNGAGAEVEAEPEAEAEAEAPGKVASKA